MSCIGKKLVIADSKPLTRNDIISFSIHTCINVTTDRAQYILSYGMEKDDTPPTTKPALVVCLSSEKTENIVRKLMARHEKERQHPFPDDQIYYILMYDNMIDVRLSCNEDDYSMASVRSVTGQRDLLSALNEIFRDYYETTIPVSTESVLHDGNVTASIPPMTEEIMIQKTADFENAYKNLSREQEKTEKENTGGRNAESSLAKEKKIANIVSISDECGEIRDGAAAPDSPARKIREQMQTPRDVPPKNDSEKESYPENYLSSCFPIQSSNTLSLIDYVNSSERYVDGDPNSKIREVLDATFKAFTEITKGMFLANERTPEEVETFNDLLINTKTQFMLQIADQSEFEAIVSYKINNTTRHEVVMVTATDQKKAKDKVLSMIENRTLQLRRDDVNYASLQFDRML